MDSQYKLLSELLSDQAAFITSPKTNLANYWGALPPCPLVSTGLLYTRSPKCKHCAYIQGAYIPKDIWFSIQGSLYLGGLYSGFYGMCVMCFPYNYHVVLLFLCSFIRNGIGIVLCPRFKFC